MLLAGLTSIHFSVQSQNAISVHGVQQLLQLSKSLRFLHIEGDTEKSLAQIANYRTSLTAVSLHGDQFAVDALLKDFPHIGSKITTLILSYDAHCALELDVDLSSIGKTCSGIRELGLIDIPFLDDRLVAQVLATCNNIVELNLSLFANTPQTSTVSNAGTCITDAVVKLIAQHCPKLQRLYLARQPRLTDQIFVIMAEEMPLLEYLCIAGITMISQEFFYEYFFQKINFKDPT
jgi:hypothetical protein